MFDVDPTDGLTLVEIADGVTEDEVAKATGCSYKVFRVVSQRKCLVSAFLRLLTSLIQCLKCEVIKLYIQSMFVSYCTLYESNNKLFCLYTWKFMQNHTIHGKIL